MSGVNGVEVSEGRIDLIPPPIVGALPAPAAANAEEHVPTLQEIRDEAKAREYASFEMRGLGFSAFISLFQQWTAVTASGFGNLFAMSSGGSGSGGLYDTGRPRPVLPGSLPVGPLNDDPLRDTDVYPNDRDGRRKDPNGPGGINPAWEVQTRNITQIGTGILLTGCLIGACLLLRGNVRPLVAAAMRV